jgi:SAM-dependent methyltransferase
MTEPISQEAQRALSFGAAAEAYDRYRPSYPPELAADVVAMAPGRRFVEIGAGTGKATAVFAAHDLDLTCVEPDPEMAAVLSRRFTGDDRVNVVVSSFEQFRPPAPYDALICAQAWHWMDKQTRWNNAAAAVRPGGVVGLFWNDEGHEDQVLTERIEAVYERYGVNNGPILTGPARRAERRAEIVWPERQLAEATGFEGFDVRIYDWIRRETVQDMIARYNTVSALLILPADVREAVSRDLLSVVTDQIGDEIELITVTGLFTCRRV